eukprot:NODE_929_length_1227_cov_249.127334_g706_i0.p1 GENE.NODE_929_length_1227_cov_249.127334_g706_i0~~NODE_929_length_1227_cov_249.127334_g706_i0.p1  ORF type:complete len:272 (-),score=55.39 NODE_929_length_1227_cov_249.127334_g706_i0:116-931(-)
MLQTSPSDAAVAKLLLQPIQPRKCGLPLVDKLREGIVQHGGITGFRGLGGILRSMDDNGNRMLSRAELKGGLLEMGIPTTELEMDTLMRHFDRDSNGQVTSQEFVGGLKPELWPHRRELVLSAFKLLSTVLGGQIRLNDLARLHDSAHHPEVLAGLKSPPTVSNEFISTWNRTGDDLITRDDFLDYYSDISAALESDDYFELLVRNVWHLTGGKGPAANSSCRSVIVVHQDGRQTRQVIRNDLGIEADDLGLILARMKEQGVVDAKAVKLA